MQSCTSVTPSATLLLKTIDLVLMSVIFVAPLFLGGRHPVGQFVFVFLVSALGLLWCGYAWLTSAPWRTNWLHYVIAAGALLVFLQLVPLSPGFLDIISPSLAERLPLWNATSSGSMTLGPWTTVSICPEETRSALAVLLAYGLLFWVITQRIKTHDDVACLLRWVALAAVGMAIIGLGQSLTATDKFLGIYDHPFRSPLGVVTGALANRNHFAHLLALGMAPLLWWLAVMLRSNTNRAQSTRFPGAQHRRFELRQDWQTWTIVGGVALVVAGGILSASRGGVLAILVSVVSFVAAMASFRLLDRRWIAPSVAAILLAATSLLIYGWQPAADRLASLFSGSLETIDGEHARQRIWAANLSAAQEFPVLGSGAGTHRYVYPTYFPDHLGVEFTHAENGYLQVLTETGVVGLLIALCAIGMLIRASWKAVTRATTKDGRLIALAATIPLVVSGFHSLIDFVWFIPACMTWTIVAAACVCRLNEMVAPSAPANNCEQRGQPHRMAWALALIVVLPGVCWMLHSRGKAALAATHWDAYLRVSNSLGADETTYHKHADKVRLAQFHLEETLSWNPEHARANLRLADVHLRQFAMAQSSSENAMPLAQIRDAVLASQFASRDELDNWLAVAVGEPRNHLDDALRYSVLAATACPLQGEAYAHCSRLAFLIERSPGESKVLLNQALLVRPFAPRLHMVAAQDAVVNGNIEKAIEHWKIAFHHGPKYQEVVMRKLAPLIPAEEFILHLQPDVAATGRLFHFYRQHESAENANVAAAAFASKLTEKPVKGTHEAIINLRQAVVAYQYIGEHQKAAACAQQAADLAPYDVKLQRLYDACSVAAARSNASYVK